MDVCAPKDGFVAKLFVHHQQEVKAGAPLLQMDSDLEDRQTERVRIFESIRETRFSRYTGQELDLLRKVAQNAVDLSTEQVNEAKLKFDWEAANMSIGAEHGTDFSLAKSRYVQAQFEQQRAAYQQAQVEFGITRNTQTNALAKELSESHLAFIFQRKDRLNVVAPTDGRVNLLVAEGSVAELKAVAKPRFFNSALESQ